MNIYVRSEAAGKRVMASVTKFLQGRLHLQVNREKSAVAPVVERRFLGYRLLADGTLAIAPVSLARVKQRIREITKRRRGVRLSEVIAELNAYLEGWLNYFRRARCERHLQRLDGWLRRRLRSLRLKQCQRSRTVVAFLKRCGVPGCRARTLALTGKG